MIPHNRLTFDKKEETALIKIVRSGYWAAGKEVGKLEKSAVNIANRKYAVGVSSGLSAIRLSLIALGIKKNDEVIVPAYSCVALANAVLSCGAKPVPADVLPDDWNISPSSIGSKISPRTKAIIAVNTFGLPAKIEAIQKFKIPVIEDCAHGFGRVNKNLVLGKRGLISISSFYATKLIGGGEGGIILTDKKNLAETAIDYRDYTDKKPSGLRLNEKMSNIDAAISMTQLKKLGSFVESRSKIAKYYSTEFAKIQKRFPPVIFPSYELRIWYRYVFYCRELKAELIIKELRTHGVNASQPIENWLTEKQISKYPNAKFALNHLISLPIFPSLTVTERASVINTVQKTLLKLLK